MHLDHPTNQPTPPPRPPPSPAPTHSSYAPTSSANVGPLPPCGRRVKATRLAFASDGDLPELL